MILSNDNMFKAVAYDLLKDITPEMILSKLNKKLELIEMFTTYNRSRIFKRAYYIYKTKQVSWSIALSNSWNESKHVIQHKRIEAKEVNNEINELKNKYHD